MVGYGVVGNIFVDIPLSRGSSYSLRAFVEGGAGAGAGAGCLGMGVGPRARLTSELTDPCLAGAIWGLGTFSHPSSPSVSVSFSEAREL